MQVVFGQWNPSVNIHIIKVNRNCYLENLLIPLR